MVLTAAVRARAWLPLGRGDLLSGCVRRASRGAAVRARARLPLGQEDLLQSLVELLPWGTSRCCSITRPVGAAGAIHARVNPAPSPGRTHVSRSCQWAPNSQPESDSDECHTHTIY
jgi:hypothetical protein